MNEFVTTSESRTVTAHEIFNSNEIKNGDKSCNKCGNYLFYNENIKRRNRKSSLCKILILVLLIIIIVCICGAIFLFKNSSRLNKLIFEIGTDINNTLYGENRKNDDDQYNIIYINDTKIELPIELSDFNIPGIQIEKCSENDLGDVSGDVFILYDSEKNIVGYANTLEDQKIHLLYLSNEEGTITCNLLNDFSFDSNISEIYDLWGQPNSCYEGMFSILQKRTDLDLQLHSKNLQWNDWHFGNWNRHMDPNTFLTIFGTDESMIRIGTEKNGKIDVMEIIVINPEEAEYLDSPIKSEETESDD